MKIKIALLAAALVAMFAGPTLARADFRTDNTWMAGTNYATRHAAQTTVTGVETGYNHRHIYNVSCKGQRNYTYDGNGMYHHFMCTANVRGNTGYWVAFHYWQIGESNWRGSDMTFFRCIYYPQAHYTC